jgi:hypothetical protein
MFSARSELQPHDTTVKNVAFYAVRSDTFYARARILDIQSLLNVVLELSCAVVTCELRKAARLSELL